MYDMIPNNDTFHSPSGIHYVMNADECVRVRSCHFSTGLFVELMAYNSVSRSTTARACNAGSILRIRNEACQVQRSRSSLIGLIGAGDLLSLIYS